MTVPLIGITTTREYNSKGAPVIRLAEAYVQAVSQAGAAPVLIPLGLPEESYQRMLPRLDGIVFSGGGDVHPSVYNSSNHPLVSEVDQDRDRVELQLIQEICSTGKPFLGICRGIQLINIALGGTLYEDILDQHPGAIRHSYSSIQPRDYLAHPVKVLKDSRLEDILGSQEVAVNSLHHQGIRGLAPRLQATAFAPDGIVEGVEMKEYPFGLAVQWHPECLQDHEPMRELFRAFVQAAMKCL